MQKSVGREVRRGSLEKMNTFLLCTQGAFVLILSRLFLRNGLNVQILETTDLAKHIGTNKPFVLGVEFHPCEHNIIVGTFMN